MEVFSIFSDRELSLKLLIRTIRLSEHADWFFSRHLCLRRDEHSATQKTRRILITENKPKF